jgi:uroporphyrin-III C-methyltransferase
MKNPMIGKVTLVGAGPGDPDLLTVKALKAITQAEVIVYDRLVSAEVMALVPPHARCINVGKPPGQHCVSQDQINDLLVSLAFRGLNVTRLKGGDPLIFGRGGEEIEALREAGIACTCIPGITAAQGAAASTLVPLTHRGLATGLRYVTGHRAANASLDLDWQSLASDDTTLVVYMGASTIPEIADELMSHGLSATTPVLAIAAATKRTEKRLQTTLGKIASAEFGAGEGEPILFIIGQVAALGQAASMDSTLVECLREHHALALA